jgi:hypothetical protein
MNTELADGWFALGDLESVVLKLSDAGAPASRRWS